MAITPQRIAGGPLNKLKPRTGPGALIVFMDMNSQKRTLGLRRMGRGTAKPAGNCGRLDDLR
jgi:hypothetical protein